jgi:hypothetical protein
LVENAEGPHAAVAVGVTGTAAVGIASLRNARQSANMTVYADHQARIWDKRASTYTDMIGILRMSAENRRVAMEGVLTSKEPDWPKLPEGWSEQQNRMIAYSSVAVLDAFDAVAKAGERYKAAVGTWVLSSMDPSHDGDEPTPIFDLPGRNVAEEALAAAAVADEELVRRIRLELHAEPEGVGRSLDSFSPRQQRRILLRARNQLEQHGR